jgi:hypothetical protein
MPDFRALLDLLLACRTNKEVQQLLVSIGDRPDVALDEHFGPHGLAWHAFGNNLSNSSTIGLGTKPGKSLAERVTNATDAIIEDRRPLGIEEPRSPRIAAQQWFGRPLTAANDGLFRWSYSGTGIDRRISVVLTQSGVELAPTIDVLDDGIGIAAEQFPSTILSLQGGNKITKWYLIGAFGQGGAATLAFCDYALIVSRHRDQPDRIGFTVVRILNVSDQFKEDTWVYLSIQSGGPISVPSCAVAQEPITLYPEFPNGPSLQKGTVVRHFSYRLNGLADTLAPSPGNLYHYLHLSLFDPLLPFRVIDLRNPAKIKDELVSGSRNRLMRLTKRSSEADDDATSGRTELRHSREMEYVVPVGGDEPSIGIEYWVVLNYRKGRKDRPDELILRGHSNELFIQKNYPIVGTLNGQTQAELSAQLLRELGLGMVARHIVIHIDASNSGNRVRRQLFSTNRESFKEGPILDGLLQVLRRMLEEDENLKAIERELTEKIAKREINATNEEVKRQVTRLLLEAGFQPSDEGTSTAMAKSGDTTVTKEPRKGKPVTAEPLQTLPYPSVTRFEIVVPDGKLDIRQNEVEVVLVETDADAEYDVRGRIAVRSEPSCLEVASKSPLKGGRVRWRLRTTSEAKVGNAGRVIASLTKPDGTQLSDSIPFEVHAVLEAKSKKIRGQVPPFEIFPVNPDDAPDIWTQLWPNLGDEVGRDKQASVAYKPFRTPQGIIIYYSTIFVPFSSQLEKLKTESDIAAQLFRENYEIWVAYHAILQENGRSSQPTLDEDVMDRILEEDRIRVAQMQVKQAIRFAELTRKLMRETAVSAVG